MIAVIEYNEAVGKNPLVCPRVMGKFYWAKRLDLHYIFHRMISVYGQCKKLCRLSPIDL